MLHCCHTDCWREILCLSNSASIAAGPHPLSIQSGRSLYSAGIPRNQQRTFGCQGTHCTFWGTRRPRSHLRPSRRYQTWLEFRRILEKDYRQILALIQSLLELAVHRSDCALPSSGIGAAASLCFCRSGAICRYTGPRPRRSRSRGHLTEVRHIDRGDPGAFPADRHHRGQHQYQSLLVIPVRGGLFRHDDLRHRVHRRLSEQS